jgi:hypothetical protein
MLKKEILAIELRPFLRVLYTFYYRALYNREVLL